MEIERLVDFEFEGVDSPYFELSLSRLIEIVLLMICVQLFFLSLSGFTGTNSDCLLEVEFMTSKQLVEKSIKIVLFVV